MLQNNQMEEKNRNKKIGNLKEYTRRFNIQIVRLPQQQKREPNIV
jgi:hypothetical protein